MKSLWVGLTTAIIAFGDLSGLAAFARTVPEITLRRLDCGNDPEPIAAAAFSDTYAHESLKIQMTYSCYLVQHGNHYLLWDAGNALNTPAGPKTALVDLLAQINVKPEQVNYLAISHYHGDHIGQAASFPNATLLIGKGDWEMLAAAQPPLEPFAPWLLGGGKVEPLTADKKDIFGDGTVVMLSTPGHTPGHHSLLVRLRTMGNVLLSGDLAHFHENYTLYAHNGVPTWNTNRADSLSSLDRFKQIAKNLRATVIIQHDRRDIGKLPVFPAAAE